VASSGFAEPRSLASPAADNGAPPSLDLSQDGLATIVRASIPLDPLFAGGARKWAVALCLEIAGRPYVLPLPSDELLPRSIRWHRGHAFRLSSRATQNGRLQLVVEPRPWRASARRQVRSLVALVGRR
jgi:hypothetical protein